MVTMTTMIMKFLGIFVAVQILLKFVSVSAHAAGVLLKFLPHVFFVYYFFICFTLMFDPNVHLPEFYPSVLVCASVCEAFMRGSWRYSLEVDA